MTKGDGKYINERENSDYHLDLTRRLGDRMDRFSPEIPPVFYLNRGLGLGFCSHLDNKTVGKYENIEERGKIIDGRFGSSEPA